MTSNIQYLQSYDLLSFLLSKRICVIKVKPASGIGFNHSLAKLFGQKYEGQIAFGEINDTDINSNDKSANLITRTWLNRLGLNNYKHLPQGYYLFIDFTVEGFHPATIQPEKFKAYIQSQHTLWGLAAGAIAGFATRDAGVGLRTFSKFFDQNQAEEVYLFFAGQISSVISSKSKQRQRNIVKTELQKAYELLKMSPIDSIEKIKKARNRLIKEVHPDKNIANFEERNRLTSEINSAFDLIKKSRN